MNNWRNARWMIPVLSILLLAAACSQPAAMPPPAPQEPAKPAEARPDGSEKIELAFWTHWDGWDEQIANFKKKHPNVDIKVTVFPYNEYEDKYLEALASGNTPDFMIVDSGQFGSFNGIDGLENLQASPYDAGAFKKDFSNALWESNLNLDRSKLIGFPLSTTPQVTYYRADVLEQYGFPSDPVQLGEFMEKPDNWLAMAKTLKSHGKWITQWPSEAVELMEGTVGMFGPDLKFLRNIDAFEKMLNIGKQVHQNGLASNNGVWTETGQESIRKGETVMLYMGTWGASQIKEWAPATDGKWRETRLPFDLYGWENYSSFVLPSQSKHKQLAWDFIKYVVTEYSMQGMHGAVPAYLPARGNPAELELVNPFLGNQKVYGLHERLVERMSEQIMTPLDKKAGEIWNKQILQGIELNRASKDILSNIEKELDFQLGREKAILIKKMSQ